MKKQLFYYALAISFLGIPGNSSAQADLKNWDAVSLALSFSKKLDLKLNHLRSYEPNNKFNNNFNQTSAQIEYDLTKRIGIMGGGMLTQFPGSSTTTKREYIRFTYKFPVAAVLNWSNSIQGEIHSKEETRFDKRLIYITRLGLQKRLPFLKLSPSITYWLYYNIGGNTIQYYEGSLPAVKQTPDGLHRSRLYFTLNSKISKNISLSLYYMRQKEFNLLTDKFHYINVIKPNGKITRAFDNYNVAGATLSFNFNIYKKP